MITTHIEVDPDNPATFPKGRIRPAEVDGTTAAQIARQQREDGTEAMRDMTRYARRIRRCQGLTQVEMARRIDVWRETIRNWEQGSCCPTIARRTLLRIFDKSPETALHILVLRVASSTISALRLYFGTRLGTCGKWILGSAHFATGNHKGLRQ
ncbi:MAG: hypothetical protein OXC91_12590 [Rhodobacteraceae bacterium]|nr:hypothetical protein [Paracoccaceae bacterium]